MTIAPQHVPVVFLLSCEHSHDQSQALPVRYGFAGTMPIIAAFEAQLDIEQQAAWYTKLLATCTETYGPHTWASVPHDDMICLGAYRCEGMDEDRAHGLLQAWHEALSLQLGKKGLDLGTIVVLTTSPQDDHEAHAHITNLYAQAIEAVA